MTEADIELILQRGLEVHPLARPRIISDNGPRSGPSVIADSRLLVHAAPNAENWTT